MRARRKLTGIAAALLILFSVALVVAIWDRHRILYPTPDTESAFLRAYTPEKTIAPFMCNLPSSHMRKSGGSAGRQFVTRDGGFEWYFAMRSENWMPLMDALQKDVVAQLRLNRAEILDSGGDEHSGFQFDYKLGHSIGRARIVPLAITPPSQIHRGAPLSSGVIETTVRIDIEEKWFPKEPGTIQVRLSDSSPN